MGYKEHGILVMASSGIGKSTHTNMWEKYEGAEIINGDRCLCRCIDNVWYTYGMPWAGSSGKYINKRVPVTTIVMLARGSENYIEKLDDFHSEISLLQRIFAPVTNLKAQEYSFEFAHDIAEKIPVIKLYCRPDLDAVKTLKQGILEFMEK